jgi:hypothetical protein
MMDDGYPSEFTLDSQSIPTPGFSSRKNSQKPAKRDP